MVRVKSLFKWPLLILVQFLLFAIFIMKTGVHRNQESLGLAKAPESMIEQVESNQADKQEKVAVEAQLTRSNAPTTTSPYDVDMVIGIPSIKRPQGKVYLDQTLKYLVERRGKIDRVIFAVYLADQDVEWTDMMTKMINETFPAEVENGMIRIITSPANIYPDWEKDMKITLGDSPHQVKWRSKQNLDSSYLMEFAYSLNPKYFLGIEDDVTAAANYLEKILQHANNEWKDGIIFASYCNQGAIGKLFFNNDILTVSMYLKAFFNYKPLDWLYWDLKMLVACRYPRNNCDRDANAAVLEYKTSLFSHNGKISSLERKKP